jgi:hypothetical protein
MARYRYRRRADARFAASAVLAGALLAALVAQAGHDGGAAGAAAARAGAGGAAQMSTASSNVALGERMAAAAGWTGAQWSCLDALWTRESGWQAGVWNTAGSGAYGIPQSLPADKMAAAGADYMTDPATQIRWGLADIRSVYGTPCGAWAHETSAGWY